MRLFTIFNIINFAIFVCLNTDIPNIVFRSTWLHPLFDPLSKISNTKVKILSRPPNGPAKIISRTDRNDPKGTATDIYLWFYELVEHPTNSTIPTTNDNPDKNGGGFNDYLQILYLTHSIVTIEEIDVAKFYFWGIGGVLRESRSFVWHDELPLPVAAFGIDEKEEVVRLRH